MPVKHNKTNTSDVPKGHSWIKLLILVPGMLCILAAAACGGAYLWMKSFITTPANVNGTPIVFSVSSGQGMATIAKNLKAAGLITDDLRFKLYARYKKSSTRVKTGEYDLSPSLPPEKILSALIAGKVKLYRITVPEGLNMEQTALLVQEKGYCSAQQFLTLCKNSAFIQELGLPGNTIEGYLYPETYLFPKHTSCKRLIKRMVGTYKKVFTQKWQARASELGLTSHEIVTLASIIEKETGNAAERPLIASVFHNRLKKNMRLESDPTVIYGVDDYHGRIRYKHLRRRTPYNTYQIKGLPAGPIANPGAKAIEAALYPAKSNFLFFVSKNDSTHKFSTTLKEHNQAVKKYQLNQ